MIECLVINLARSTDRLAFQRAQIDRLGLPFGRIEAVTAEEANGMRPEAYWQTWERPLRPAERACLLSHVAAWEWIASSGRPMLVLEDDAVLSRRVPALLSALAPLSGLDHVTLEVRGRRKLLSTATRDLGGGLVLRRLYQDRTGAAAYVLWPAGAAKLLARAKHEAALADAMICKSYELLSWQVEPPCAVQLDRCAHYGLPLPLATRSTIDGAGAERPQPSLRQKLRRIGAQLRMGWRQFSRSFQADKRELRPNPADFT